MNRRKSLPKTFLELFFEFPGAAWHATATGRFGSFLGTEDLLSGDWGDGGFSFKRESLSRGQAGTFAPVQPRSGRAASLHFDPENREDSGDPECEVKN